MDKEKSRDRTVLKLTEEITIDNSTPTPSDQVTSLEILQIPSQDTLLYIGTSSGRIILFSCATNNFGQDLIFKNLTSRSITNKPLKEIVALTESNRVVALSEEIVFMFDVYLVESINQLFFTRGASAIAVRTVKKNDGCCSSLDSMTGIMMPQNFVKGMGETSEFLKRIGGASRVSKKGLKNSNSDVRGRNMSSLLAVSVGNRLFLCEIMGSLGSSQSWSSGFDHNVRTKETSGVDGVVTMSWVDDSVFVGTCSGYVLINVSDGNVIPMFTFPDPSGVPITKCLTDDGEVILLMDNVGIVVNGFGQPCSGSLLFRFRPESVGCCGCYVVVAQQGQVEVFHKDSGLRVQSMVLHSSGCSVVGDFKNGGFVVVASKSKVSFLLLVPIEEQLKELLRKKNYDEAIFLAKECIKKGEGKPAEDRLSFVHAQVGFLLLFDLQFREAVDHFLQSDIMQPSEIFPFIIADSNRWSPLVPRNRYWGLHPPPRPLEEVIENGLSTLQRGALLKKAGLETGGFSDDHTILPSPSNRSALLEIAIENIIRYLKVSRNKDLTYQMKEGIDTVLMYLYRVLGLTEEMEQLASRENFCVVEELESLLKESGHLRTLALLYASKGSMEQSLGIWRTIAESNLTIHFQNSSNGRKRGNRVYSSSERLAAASEAAKLLEKSSEHNLVLDHLAWILEIDHDLVVEVLMSSERETPLPPDEVFSTIDPHAIDVHERYLQWLIEDQGSEDPQYHTLYALLLAKEALDGRDMKILNDNSEQSVKDSGSNERSKSDEKANMVEVASDKANCNGSIVRPIRERLQLFLLSSDKYDPDSVLDLIKDSELWPEQAMLYRKLGQETLVLQILALKLGNSEAAEQYCAEVGRPEAYMQLLDMYLDPGEGKQPLYKAAVRLLHCHGQSLDPLQVLETLSSDMPLHLASDIISRMLRARAHHHREGQIVQNLSRALNLDARLSRFEERSRNVQINDETICDSCHARLGTKLFAMYPNDHLVCYKCFKRAGENVCPVTGRDFKKDPMFKPSWLVRMDESD